MVSFEEHEVKGKKRAQDSAQEVGIRIPFAVGVHVNFISVNISAALCTHGHAAIRFQLSKAGDVPWFSDDVSILVASGDEKVCVGAELSASPKEGWSVNDGHCHLFIGIFVCPVHDHFGGAAVADLLFQGETSIVRRGRVHGVDVDDVITRVVACKTTQAFWAADAFASQTVHEHWGIFHRLALTWIHDLQVRRVKWITA